MDMKSRVVNSIQACWRHMTLEPSITLMYLSTIISNSVFSNMILQRRCRFNAAAEPDLTTPCDDEKAGQLYLAQTNSWRNSIGLYLMIAFTIFGSSWSDKAGRRRRPLIYIPLVGQLLVCLTGCMYSYFWYWPVLWGIILETVIHGVTGSRFSLLYTTQLYMCDLTTNENRTTRIGILSALHIISIQIGSSVNGYMMRHLGFFFSFVVCAAMMVLSLVLAILWIKDTSVPSSKSVPFWRALNPTELFESFQIVFKERPLKRRTIITLLLVIDVCVIFPSIGESTVLYLYTRYRFGWNEIDYSQYIFCKLAIITLGTLVSAIFLSRYLKLHDGYVGFLSCSLCTIAALLFMHADEASQLYWYSIFDLFRGTPWSVISAFMTKCLEKHETGHLMSIRCVISLATPLCFPIYNYTYKATMQLFPSAFFLISVAAFIPSIVLFGIVYRISVNNQAETPLTNNI